MRGSSDHWAVNFSACQRNETSDRTLRADEQEAEASVSKLFCSFVDDGLESELLEEYGECWTSHTAAYNDDFGHMRFQVTRARADPNMGRGRNTLLAVEELFLGGRGQVS